MGFWIGVLAGAFGGLVGLGGGVVMVPLLTGWLGFHQRLAQGTSLIALAFTGMAGAAAYGVNGSVDWEAAAWLSPPAMLTAWMGARYCNRLPEWKLKRVFGVFLIAVSALMLLKPFLHPVVPAASGCAQAAVLVTAGLITGFLSGLLGIGGGALMTGAMALALGYGQHAAQGSSLAAMTPVAIVGAWAYRRFGTVATGVLKGLVPGLLLGAAAGAELAHLVPDGALRAVFAAVLIATGLNGIRANPSQTGEACGPSRRTSR